MEQPAGQGAVVEAVIARGPQAHPPPQVRVAHEDGGLPAAKSLAQHGAQQAVEPHQLLGLAQAFAVGRIRHHQAQIPLATRGGLTQVAALEVDLARQPGALQIVEGYPDRGRVPVVAPDRGLDGLEPRQTRGPALPRLRQEFPPGARFMPQPAGHPPMDSGEAGGNVGGNQGALDAEGAGAAQGVEEGGALPGHGRPGRTQQDGGRQVFLEGRGAALMAVAPQVQGVAGKVQAEGHLTAMQIGLDAQIRPLPVHAGALAKPGTEAIDDGVLDPQGAKLAVADAALRPVELDREGAAQGEMLLPGQGAGPGVKAVAVGGREAGQRQQHPVGDPRPEAGAVGVRERAREAGTPPGLLGRGEAEVTQLIGKQGFQVPGGGGKEVGHGGAGADKGLA